MQQQLRVPSVITWAGDCAVKWLTGRLSNPVHLLIKRTTAPMAQSPISSRNSTLMETGPQHSPEYISFLLVGLCHTYDQTMHILQKFVPLKPEREKTNKRDFICICLFIFEETVATVHPQLFKTHTAIFVWTLPDHPFTPTLTSNL